MRKMKKINGFLVVRFNDRELREWKNLGNYGIIDAEIYTGKLEIDRGAMEYDDIENIEEAVEMARGLNVEEDYTTQPSTYAVIEEIGNDVVERVEVDPQFMIDRWTKNLEGQIESTHHPGVNSNTARHELYGFMVALSELGLLNTDKCFVLPNSEGTEGAQLNEVCEEVSPETLKKHLRNQDRQLKDVIEMLKEFRYSTEIRSKELGKSSMEKELIFLEELLEIQYSNLRCYSNEENHIMPKEGYESDWIETKERIDMLVRIMKLVHAEALTLKGENKHNIILIAEKLLNESASAYIYGDADSAEVQVVDELHRTIIAKFTVKIASHCLLFKKYKFY